MVDKDLSSFILYNHTLQYTARNPYTGLQNQAVKSFDRLFIVKLISSK